jgi:hypothetical protein
VPHPINPKRLAFVLACIATLAILGAAALAWNSWNRFGRQGTQEWHTIHDHDAAERTKDQARPLIEAIERYRTTNGHLPATLIDLTPTFLPAIPTPEAGRPEFRYGVFKDKFEIRFGTGFDMYPGYYYDSATKTWSADF